MVFLDSRQQRGISADIKRLVLSLLGISILYIGLIRPVQAVIVTKAIVPYFETKLSVKSRVGIGSVEVDQFNLIGPFKPVKIELPFNGWFWLSLGLFFSSGNARLIRILTLYHLFLFFLLLISVFIIAEGFFVWSVVINIHENTYKILFLILSFMSLVYNFQNKERCVS